MKKTTKPQPEKTKATSEAWRNKMRVLLRGRNLSQRKLAKAIGSSDSLVAKWMSGDSGMSYASARKVAAVFGVTVDELMSDDPLRPETVASFFSTGENRVTDTARPSGNATAQPGERQNSSLSGNGPGGPESAPVIQPLRATQPDPREQETDEAMDERRRRLHGLIDAIPPEALEDAAENAVTWLAQWYSKKYLGSGATTPRRGLQ